MRISSFIKLISFGLVLTCESALAQDSSWCLVTDSGKRIAMNNVACLAAADDDSTFAVVLRDGATVTNVRRATFAQALPTGLQQISPSVFTAKNVISLSNLPKGSEVSILSADGKSMYRGKADNDLNVSSFPQGVYVVRVGDTSFKFRKL